MRGYIFAMLIWSLFAQVSSACHACKARAGHRAHASAYGHSHSSTAACSQCAAACTECAPACDPCAVSVAAPVCDPCSYHACGQPACGYDACGYGGFGCDPCASAFCSPTDPQLFYAELYRRYYAELKRLNIQVSHNRSVNVQPRY